MVLPRIGATFQSGPEAGYGSSFGSLYAFVPFAQVPGLSTFYTEGRANFFTHDGDFGGNLRLGYRTLLPETDLVLGGYIGWDARRTEFDETFHQLGFGLDLQGEKWEISANGYFPIGLTRREVANDFYDSGTVISNLRFSGNNLLFSRFRQQTTSRLFEAAMTGFDLEGGYQLLSWETGNLYAYAGAYFLDAPGGSSFVGVRGRLQAEIDDFQAGVSLQSDGNFGTNVAFNVGMTFGGNSTRKKEETPEESVISRLGSGARRQETIAIDRQNEVTTTIDQDDNAIALNTATGEALRFIFVQGGATGDCSFENPCGQVTEGIALAQTSGNDIVYVDAGTNPGLNGFAIPDNVQVLSTAFAQFFDYQINTTLGGSETFTTQLPGTGTGVRPLLNGTTVTVDGFNAMVAMGNNSTLSGFDIQPPTTNLGVIASNVSGFTVDQNQITTTGTRGYGIFAYADGGTINNATISGNTVSSSGIAGHVIFARANNGGTISNMAISGNTISSSANNTNGILVRADSTGEISNTTISGNTISTSGFNNYALTVISLETISNTTISGNTISTSGVFGTGISIRPFIGTIDNTTISDNTISTTGNNAPGIFVRSQGTLNNATISGNTISTSGAGLFASGVFIDAYTAGAANIINNVSITNNLIEQAGTNSITIRTRNAGDNICIAQFTGNTSGMPNASGGGGSDMSFVLTGGSTANFVGFTDIASNNTGFDDISGAPTGTPTSCP
ncbi:MAG: beta strand repeat-containing protein [Spirulina sp.]